MPLSEKPSLAIAPAANGGRSGREDPANVQTVRSLISSASIGATNRRRLLQILYDMGPSSRSRLARALGVNRATITGIVQPLVEEGVLTEFEPLPSTSAGGKPARPLWFSPDSDPICAVLFTQNSVRTALVSMSGEVYGEHRETVRPSARSTAAGLDKLNKCLTATLAETNRTVQGIGVAVGGMVDTTANTIVTMSLAPAFSGFPLGSEIESRFGLPVWIDHHPQALLLGDRWFGIGRNVNTFASIYTGDSLGSALFFDGHIYNGPGGAGGEIGHTIVNQGGDICHCGQRGCWETIAALPWLRETAKQRGMADAERLDSASLLERAQQEVPGADELLDEYARNVAIGIANLQQVMAPSFYVLHGDVVRGGEPVRRLIEKHVKDLALDHPGARLQILLGSDSDDTALRGAAGLVLSAQLRTRL